MAINIKDLTDQQIIDLARRFNIDIGGFTQIDPGVKFDKAPFAGATMPGQPYAGATIPTVPTGPTLSALGLTVGAPDVTIPTGVRDIVREAYEPATQQALEDLRVAAQREADLRGMAIADTPIGQSYLRQVGRLGASMRGQEAQSILGLIGQREQLLQRQAEQQESARQARFGLQSQDVLARAGLQQARAGLQQRGGEFTEQAALNRALLAQRAGEFIDTTDLSRAGVLDVARRGQQTLQLAARDFQETLRQRAIQNRLAQAQLAGQLALGGMGSDKTITTSTTGGGGGFLDYLKPGMMLGLGLSGYPTSGKKDK
jgi:hypothetical protein